MLPGFKSILMNWLQLGDNPDPGSCLSFQVASGLGAAPSGFWHLINCLGVPYFYKF